MAYIILLHTIWKNELYAFQMIETKAQVQHQQNNNILTFQDKLCGYLPNTISKECVTFVDTYSDMIIDFIVQGLTPDQVWIENCLIKHPKGVPSPKNFHNPYIPSLPKVGKNLIDPPPRISNRVHL